MWLVFQLKYKEYNKDISQKSTKNEIVGPGHGTQWQDKNCYFFLNIKKLRLWNK